MGKLITFWSPVIGQARVTSSVCAIVSALAIQQTGTEIAVSSVGAGDTGLEDSLENKMYWRKSKELYERSGVAALILAYKQGELTRERIRRCCLPLAVPSVTLFPGLNSEVQLIYGRDMERLEYLILAEYLKREYELVFLDLKNGMDERSFRYMEASDLIVLVVPQNPKVWKCVYQLCRDRFREKKIYLLFGGYLSDCKYNMARYRREFEHGKRTGIGAVLMNEGYLDALAEGKAAEFFLKNEYVMKKEENYEFMALAKRAAKEIKESVFLS